MKNANRNAPDAGPADEQLMLMAGRGDRDAFAALVRRHQAGVVNFFRRMGDYTGAEDLAQETFLRLYRCAPRYRPSAKFTTFLYLLARRAWIDSLRARERRRLAHEALAEEEAAAAGATRDARGAREAMRERVDAALGRLSDEMRCVVVLSVYGELKYREIAEALGIPLGTVKTRMFHALRKLKELLAHEDPA